MLYSIYIAIVYASLTVQHIHNDLTHVFASLLCPPGDYLVRNVL